MVCFSGVCFQSGPVKAASEEEGVLLVERVRRKGRGTTPLPKASSVALAKILNCILSK